MQAGKGDLCCKGNKMGKGSAKPSSALQGAAQGLSLPRQHLLGVSVGLCGSSLQGGHRDLSTASLSSSLEPFERLPCNLPPSLQPAPLHLPVPGLSPCSLLQGSTDEIPGKSKHPFLCWLSWESQVTGSKLPISDHFNSTNPCHVRQSQHLLWKTLTRQREQSQPGPWPQPGNTLK